MTSVELHKGNQVENLDQWIVIPKGKSGLLYKMHPFKQNVLKRRVIYLSTRNASHTFRIEGWKQVA